MRNKSVGIEKKFVDLTGEFVDIGGEVVGIKQGVDYAEIFVDTSKTVSIS